MRQFETTTEMIVVAKKKSAVIHQMYSLRMWCAQRKNTNYTSTICHRFLISRINIQMSQKPAVRQTMMTSPMNFQKP